MSEGKQRKPSSFRIEPEKPAEKPKPAKENTKSQPRKPRSVPSEKAVPVVLESTNDPFDLPDTVTAPPNPLPPPRRKSPLFKLFAGATAVLISLAVGLWVDSLVRDLFARNDWLGWFAIGLVGIAILSLLAILVREMAALSRLASISKLQIRAEQAYADDDAKAAKSVVSEVSSLLSGDPALAAARKSMVAHTGEIIDGQDLIELAEIELMRPLDTRARRMILEAAKRVSVVTAVSPRALVDVGYVLFEAGRLIRRISELYGGRPGTAGFLRLIRNVAGHLAVTGSIAVGDSLVQQVLGHGLAARLSSRLGEGVVNGMMTARIGIAAMDVVRPLPFKREKRPGVTGFLSDLARFSGNAGKDTATGKSSE